MTHLAIKVHQVLYLPKTEQDFSALHSNACSKNLNFENSLENYGQTEGLDARDTMFH
jgi:hypothetical protein